MSKKSKGPKEALSFVAFVDILGVREMMSRGNDDDRSSLLSRLRAAYDATLPELREQIGVGTPSRGTVTSFTDNIVVTHPLWPAPGATTEQSAGAIVVALAYFQMDMLLHGFFVRGGIDIGRVYVDRDMVFGEALLRAYDAERTIARDPRIVFTTQARDNYFLTMEAYGEVLDTPHHAFALIDSDEISFVNYLTIALTETNDGYPDESAVERHRDAIVHALSEHHSHPYVWNKYRWAANYHNMLVKQYSLSKALRVPASSLHAEPRHISTDDFQTYKRRAKKLRKEIGAREFVEVDLRKC